MAGTDYWPQEEGYIVEGSPVMMCYADGTITENSAVILGGTTAGVVRVAVSTVWGDAMAVALRSAATGQMVPVAFAGVVKMLVGGTLALGQQVCNEVGGVEVIDTPTSVNIKLGDNGTAYVLGTALQAATDDEDEILILLGRW